MKIYKHLLLAFSAAIVFASCKKDDPTPVNTPTIVGLWKGKYGNGATTYPNAGYAFLYRSNGTVRVFNSADTATALKAEGTYTVTGTTVACSYTYVSPGSGTYATTATVNAGFTFIEGSWGSGTSNTNGGLYFVTK